MTSVEPRQRAVPRSILSVTPVSRLWRVSFHHPSGATRYRSNGSPPAGMSAIHRAFVAQTRFRSLITPPEKARGSGKVFPILTSPGFV
jgi:hypothetical protein